MSSETPRAARAWLGWLWIWVAPWVLPWVLLVAVVKLPPSAPVPRTTMPMEARRSDRCTWACHNRGCTHRSALPAVLTSDRGLFGATVRGLFALGALFSSNPARGYGIANILVFCVAWPALMYALWVGAWRDRARIRALERSAQPEGVAR